SNTFNLSAEALLLLDKEESIDPRVPGRIHLYQFRKFWCEDLQASDMHLAILEEGYKLPFTNTPPRSMRPNNFSARRLENFEFILGAIREVCEIPYLFMPLQVVEQIGRKKRLITDPSLQLNPYLRKKPVKLDNLQSIASSIGRSSWFAVLDLSSGYYHICIHEPHQKFLGFAWTGQDQVKRYYVWSIAFLGLSPLVELFTKIQKPVISYLRLQGIQCYIYIDDMIIFGCLKSSLSIEYGTSQARLEQSRLGGKSAESSRTNSTLCSNVAIQRSAHIRELARVYGKILANLIATGPQIILLVRQGLKAIASASSWESIIAIKPLWGELQHLAKHFNHLDGYPMTQDYDKIATSLCQTASDASGQAVSVVKIICNQGITHKLHSGRCGFQLATQFFNSQEQANSSSWRELKGLDLLLKTQGTELSQKTVVHWTDSRNVERIMSKGSSVDELPRFGFEHFQDLALSIYNYAKELRIDLNVIWRPRSDPRLKLADDFSRAIDSEDYGIDNTSFQHLQKLAGRSFDFDLFATDHNFRTANFASILASNKALFRDAFTHSWENLGFCYAHPPVKLVGAVIKKIIKDSAQGILVIPFWKTMKDWLSVCQDGVHLNNVFIRGTAIQPQYRKGQQVISNTFQNYPNFSTLALEFNGDAQHPLESRVCQAACSKVVLGFDRSRIISIVNNLQVGKPSQTSSSPITRSLTGVSIVPTSCPVEHPNLQRAELRARDLKLSSKAYSTWINYKRSFYSFKSWCTPNNLNPLPASSKSVELFLADLAFTKKSVSSVNSAVAAIAAFHKLQGYENPCVHNSISTLLQGIRRRFGQPATQRHPITKEELKMLLILCVSPTLQSGSVLDYISAWLESILFHASARWSDISSLHFRDLKYDNGNLVIVFPTRKNDQLHEGHTITISFLSVQQFCLLPYQTNYSLFQRARQTLSRSRSAANPSFSSSIGRQRKQESHKSIVQEGTNSGFRSGGSRRISLWTPQRQDR
ncbi:hypothetical protein TCAL_11252, partial [Tigriopus californicus]